MTINMTIHKETTSLNMPWEQEYGYSQAVKVGDTIYLSGRVSHDSKGNVVGINDMEMQMRQSYTNIQTVLAHYGATMDNIVDEMLFVPDMETGHAAASKCRREVFAGTQAVASTIVQIQRLALPEFMMKLSVLPKCHRQLPRFYT